ncbi:MAG: WbqC family protein [Selenomonadaceae bacterium]|nr:WbqC family protein [Selenomonadaceae bacterium]
MIMAGETMRLGIMQPYFFPYIGYFSLIDYCDEFVFFDTPQFISHGWINRNRILKQSGNPAYITVPIRRAPRNTAINNIVINNELKWKEKIYGQLSYYKRKAPHYSIVMELVRSVLEKPRDSLSNLCIDSINTVCDFLELDIRRHIFSDMELGIYEVNSPDEWALRITQEMKFDTYVNPPGGMSFFDRGKYTEAGIKLEFLRNELTPYIQRIGHFEPGLSIIDVLMFCSTGEAKSMLKDFQIM